MWGETTHTLVQYKGVVHCVGGDNAHTSAVWGGWSTVWGETTHTLVQYGGVVHCVGGDNAHTSAVWGGGPLCGGRQYTH